MSGSNGGTGSVTDASIPLQAGRGVQQANPLAQVGQFAELQGAVNRNNLFPLVQQQMQLANQRSGIGLQSDQSALIQQQRQLGAGALAPLLAKKGPLSIDDVTSALAGAEKSGVVTQPMLADFMNVKMTGDPAVDDASIRAHILANSQAPAAAAAAVTPGQVTVDQGPVIQPYTVGARGMPGQGVYAPVGGAIGKGIGPQYVNTGAGNVATNNGQPTGAPPIANQLSPAQLATPTQIGVGPHGEPIMGTLGQFLNKTGGASPLGSGRPLPPGLRNPANPAPAAAPGAVPGGGVVTGQGPAQTAAQSATGTDSAHAFTDITNQGTAARSQASVLDNMLADTSQFTTGPLQSQIQKLREVGQRFGFPVDANATSSAESFNKLAAQLASAQNPGSDARMNVSLAANPHGDLSPGGVDLILRQLRGNADYLQARQTLAAGYPDKSDLAGFESSVGKHLDPRVFQYSRMTPEQKATFLGGMKDSSKFKQAYGWAADNGLIGGANGG